MSALEKIGSDRHLQDHWLRRLIAGIIDSAITWAIAWIISTIITFPALLLGGIALFGAFPFLSGVIFLLYASFFESSRGATIGKQIMNLKVTTTDKNTIGLYKAFLRNISKIHGLLWLIDTLIGMAMVGDPHQKYSDRFIGTTVTSTVEKNIIMPETATSTSPQTPPSST